MARRILAKRYELLEKIGEGGMSVVFKAQDLLLDRRVALKILRPEYTKDESFIESFRRESQLISGIVDSNIVQVYDVGQEGNIHYIVMELVEGETLSEIIARDGKLDAHTVVSYAKQIAMALSTAHKNSLIHRDIKPHNIMVTKDNVAKLADFGIAKRTTPGNNPGSEEKEAVMGSIHYFSPEQARGNKVDERSDIYSLGIVMYEMITGQVPYDGENAVEVAVKHMNSPMVPPSKLVPEIPVDLENIILKATAKNADNRYSSAEDMIVDLNFVKFSRLAKDEADYNDNSETKPEEDKSKEKKKKNKKSSAKTSISIFVALALIIVPLIWTVIGFVVDFIKDSKKTVLVPDLFECSYEDAEKLLKEQGLEIDISIEVVNDSYPERTVVSQRPIAKTEVRPGSTVKVNITKLGLNLRVPNVVNLELSVAQSRLNESSLQYEIVHAYDSNVMNGFIIRTEPEAGLTIERDDIIKVYVSDGPDPEEKESFKIDLFGMSLEEAEALLASRGCTIKEIKKAESTKVEPGCIFGQSPSALTEVTEGTEFIVSVRNSITNDKVVSFTVDLSDVQTEKCNIKVLVTDANNPNGKYQYTNNAYDIAADGSSLSLSVKGQGSGQVIVIIDDSTINYTVDFDNGTIIKN